MNEGSSLRKELRAGPAPVIDWKAYFRRFCEEHGDPIQLDSWLLFPDAWRYGLRGDYTGPEMRPPDDPEKGRLLLVRYFRCRLDLVKSERDEIRRRLAWLRNEAGGRSLPLMETRRYVSGEREDGLPMVAVESSELSTEAMEERLRWLDEDVGNSEAKLRGLETAEVLT